MDRLFVSFFNRYLEVSIIRSAEHQTEHTLLLVEDDRILAMTERLLLGRAGYSVVEAHSGSEAVEAAAADTAVDLVLMDIDLGEGINGVEAARRILEFRELPVVFLTSHTEEDYVNLAKEVSNYGYVVKSSGEFVLLRSIETAFELFYARKREKRQIRRYEQLLHSSEEPIVSYDGNGRVFVMNTSAAQTLGGVPEDFIGKGMSEILPEANVGRGLATIQHVFETGESVKREDTVRLHGVDRYYDMRFEPIRDDEDEIYAVLTTSRDVTEKRTAEKKLQAALEEKDRLMRELNHRVKNTPGDGCLSNSLEAVGHWQ